MPEARRFTVRRVRALVPASESRVLKRATANADALALVYVFGGFVGSSVAPRACCSALRRVLLHSIPPAAPSRPGEVVNTLRPRCLSEPCAVRAAYAALIIL